MEFRRDDLPPGPIVRGFSGTGFRVGDDVFADGMLLDPHHAAPWSAPGQVDALTIDDFGLLLALSPAPEFMILGTGLSLVQPSRKLVAAIEARGLGVEAMDSRAAARAWGVLRQEERWIVAALMPLR
jgi:uncharacterized protein